MGHASLCARVHLKLVRKRFESVHFWSFDCHPVVSGVVERVRSPAIAGRHGASVLSASMASGVLLTNVRIRNVP